MFSKINRRGPKEKRPVTNMYGVVVIPEEEAGQNMMLNQPTQRTNEWLSRATIAGVRGTNFHYEQPGIYGNLENPNEKNRTLSIASLLMAPYGQEDGNVLESPVIKVVRDTPGFTDSRYHVYGRTGDKNKVLQHVGSMKTQIKNGMKRQRSVSHRAQKDLP